MIECMYCRQLFKGDNLPEHACTEVPQVPPPIAGKADREYATRIEAARITAEWRTKLSTRVDCGQQSIEDSPLFGGERQGGLF